MAIWGKKHGNVIVTFVNPTHTTCFWQDEKEIQAHNRQIFLLDVIPKMVTVDQSKTITKVKGAIANHYSRTVSYQAAKLASRT